MIAAQEEGELARLRVALAFKDDNWRLATEELIRLRAAAPAAIGCRNGRECGCHEYPWAACFLVRDAFVRVGLIEKAEQPAEERGGGA